MNKKIKILSVVLVLQLLVVGIVNANWHSDSRHATAQLLLPDIKMRIDEIQIVEVEKTLDIKKQANKWVLSGSNNLPVAQEKIADALDSLFSLKTSWPVAKTASAAERFEVAEKHFNKKIDLKADGKKQQAFFLGTSPGFKKTHLRLADAEAIYAANLNSYDYSTDKNDWLDKTLLKIPQSLLKSIDFNDVSIVKKESQWLLADQADNEEPNVAELNKVVNFTDQLLVSGILDDIEKTKFQLLQPVVTLRANTGVQQIDYNVYLEGDNAAIKSSLRPEWFKLPKYKVEQLQALNRQSFVTFKKQEQEQQASEESNEKKEG